MYAALQGNTLVWTLVPYLPETTQGREEGFFCSSRTYKHSTVSSSVSIQPERITKKTMAK